MSNNADADKTANEHFTAIDDVRMPQMHSPQCATLAKSDYKTTEEIRFAGRGRQLAALKDRVAIQRYILPTTLARSLIRRHPSPD
jgi:hypothetical protein